MNSLKLVRVSFIFLLIFLSGCRIVSTVPIGGKITYRGGMDYCLSGKTCVTEVNDLFFDEAFVAVPDDGYAFMGWVRKHRSLCGESDQPCRLFTSEFEGNPSLEAILESDDEFYLEPVFKAIAESVSCSDHPDPDPGSFSGNIESVVSNFLRVHNCNYIELQSDDFYVHLAFLTIWDGGTPITGPTGLRFVITEGDLIPAWAVTEKYLDIVPIRSNGIVPMLYIDSDGKLDTGMPLSGVMGADYRFSLTTCFSAVFDGEVEGFTYYWDENLSRWNYFDVLTENYAGGAVRVASGVFISPLTGSGTFDISPNPLAVIRLEKADETCFGRGKSVGSSSVFRIGSF